MMRNTCHCLVIEEGMEFYRCCGWYCNRCKGRISESYKINHGKAAIS